MKTLQILDFNRRVLGAISVTSGGQLELEIFERGHHLAFDALMRHIISTPLPLRTYERVFLPDRVRLETRVDYVEPGDPDFLWAVRDYLDRHRLGSIPVLGHVVEQPMTSGNVEGMPS